MDMVAYEKGVELEKLVYRLFLSRGYDVKHNVKLRGRSGVDHQVDVYVEYRAPLHVSRIVVESDLLPALKGEGSGEVWSYIPSEGWVQFYAWSQAHYPYPAHSGARGYGFCFE
ncbi:MAG: hypothetical protein QXJ97_09360 [Desulfurococcaceae archaeon]